MTTALTLFEIAQEYRHITDVLMDAGVDEQTLTDTLEGEAWPLELKAQNYGFMIRNLEATAEAINKAIKKMSARAEVIERRAERLRERLKTGMEIAGVKKLECPYFAISIAKNTSSIDVWDEKQVPDQYRTQPPKKISKTLIREAIDKGVEVPGAKKVRGTRIAIK